jgi:hypothetical protein
VRQHPLFSHLRINKSIKNIYIKINIFERIYMLEYTPNRKLTDLINITEEQLNEIKKIMAQGEYRTIFSDSNLEISLLKENHKVYELVYWFGKKPFTEVFKEITKIKYST